MSNRDLILIGIAIGVGWLLLARAGRAVDPTSSANVAASGVDAIGDVLNDGEADGDFRLGVWVHNMIHGTDYGIDDGRIIVPAVIR